MKALSAFISIWFLFVGIIMLSSKPLIAFILVGFGGLFLAIAYGAFGKPAFFLLPATTILTGFLFSGIDSKGMFPLFGMLIGIAVSSRCIKYYYGSRERKSERKQEIEKKKNSLSK